MAAKGKALTILPSMRRRNGKEGSGRDSRLPVLPSDDLFHKEASGDLVVDPELGSEVSKWSIKDRRSRFESTSMVLPDQTTFPSRQIVVTK